MANALCPEYQLSFFTKKCSESNLKDAVHKSKNKTFCGGFGGKEVYRVFHNNFCPPIEECVLAISTL